MKNIEERELPEFVIDFIGDFISKKISLLNTPKEIFNKLLIEYSFLSEEFCLLLQTEMIKELKKNKPEPLSLNPLPLFVISTKNRTINGFVSQFKIINYDIYEKYIDEFSKEFIKLLISRIKK